jgi:hypothetical protein
MPEKKKLIPKFPTWFGPWSRPGLPYKPEEYIVQKHTVSRVQVYSDDKLPIEEGYSYCLDLETGWDHEPSNVYLIKYAEVKVKNINYKNQLKNYEEALKRIEEWEKLNALWPEYQKQEESRKELATYKKLKKKFENI